MVLLTLFHHLTSDHTSGFTLDTHQFFVSMKSNKAQNLKSFRKALIMGKNY